MNVMKLTRIKSATPLDGFRLRLGLTDGRTIERDVGRLLKGAIFDAVRKSKKAFDAVRAEGGTIVWPGGADLCPDVVIWDGRPPWSEAAEREPKGRERRPSRGGRPRTTPGRPRASGGSAGRRP